MNKIETKRRRIQRIQDNIEDGLLYCKAYRESYVYDPSEQWVNEAKQSLKTALGRLENALHCLDHGDTNHDY